MENCVNYQIMSKTGKKYCTTSAEKFNLTGYFFSIQCMEKTRVFGTENSEQIEKPSNKRESSIELRPEVNVKNARRQMFIRLLPSN